MRFRMRMVFFSLLTIASLATLLLMCQVNTVLKISSLEVTRSMGSIVPKIPITCDRCESTNSSNSTADIRTLYIYDNFKFTNKGRKYEIQFPKEDKSGTSNDGPKSPIPEKLTVLIIPHSHNDPGWLKTLDQYYEIFTSYILDTMIIKLKEYPDMKIVWAETVLLSMWFDAASEASKTTFRQLVDNGQIDIVTGGWVMPDEASTHYYSIIDQLIEGHQWLLKNLNVKPRINWSIDPFGHSGTVPYIWRLAGFEGMVIQRVHQAVKNYLGHYQKLEFYWRQTWDKEGKHDIFCHMMPYLSYDTASTCGPDESVCKQYKYAERGPLSVGEPGTLEYNTAMEEHSRKLYEQYRKKAENYQHNAIFVPLGGDFRWHHHSEWSKHYLSYSKLMSYMNSKPDWNINVRFGTLREYFDLISPLKNHRNPSTTTSIIEKHLNYPTLSGDFYVYSDNPGQYWSGYFTSRPLDKFLGREVQASLKAADILHVLASLYSKTNEEENSRFSESNKLLENARRNLALFQHHDAITGTAKPHVVKDYETRLIGAFSSLQTVIRRGIGTLLHLEKNIINGNKIPDIYSKTIPDAIDLFSKTFKLNLTVEKTSVVVFNPLPIQRNEVLTIIVDTPNIKVSDAGRPDVLVPHQVSPIWQDSTKIREDSFEVSFVVTIPPLGIFTYTIAKDNFSAGKYLDVLLSTVTRTTDPTEQLPFKLQPMERFKRYTLENACLRVTFPGANGMPTEIFDKVSNTGTQFTMEYISYKPAGSGAYLFRPKDEPVKRLTFEVLTVSHVVGPLFSVIHVTHPLFRSTIKLFNVTQADPMCWAISIENVATLDRSGENEVAMRFNTDVENKDILYTDGNGLSMVKHRRYEQLPIQAGYYPMTTMAVIQDNTKRITVHAGQPLGAASLREGSLEIMLDRTFFSDDGKGLDQGITNNSPAPSRFFLSVETGVGERTPPVDSFYPTLVSGKLNDLLQNPFVVVTHSADDNMLTSVSPMSGPLPCDGHIVSLRSLQIEPSDSHTTALIIHKRGYECGSLCRNLTCSLDWTELTFSTFFQKLKPSRVREMTLSYMDIKNALSANDYINLDTMDIKSYYISWY